MFNSDPHNSRPGTWRTASLAAAVRQWVGFVAANRRSATRSLMAALAVVQKVGAFTSGMLAIGTVLHLLMH